MQEKSAKRPNAERSRDMRARLIAVARACFVEKGYAETSTPEIVRAAEVTRGALYHHFEGKSDLFRAVIEAEAGALRDAIDAEVAELDEETALEAGTDAFFAAMAAPGRARLLLIEGPAVLGPEEMDRIDAGGGRAALRAGLAASRPWLSADLLEALAEILSAAYDRAALSIAQGAAPDPYRHALLTLMRRIEGPEEGG